MGKKYNHFSESEFKKVKMLIDAGLSFRQLKEVTGRSSSLINYVKKSDNYESYQAMSRARWEKKPQVPSVAAAVASRAQPQPHATVTIALMNRSVAAQERQADALEALVQAWNSSPAKKKLF